MTPAGADALQLVQREDVEADPRHVGLRQQPVMQPSL